MYLRLAQWVFFHWRVIINSHLIHVEQAAVAGLSWFVFIIKCLFVALESACFSMGAPLGSAIRYRHQYGLPHNGRDALHRWQYYIEAGPCMSLKYSIERRYIFMVSE